MSGSDLRLGLAAVAFLAIGTAPPAAAQDIDHIDRVAGSSGFSGGVGVGVAAPGALVFASFDRDSNGRITVAEIDAGAASAFVAADRNGDGRITGFEQTDWAISIGSPTDVMANAMTFDIDLDRSVTRTEFAAGLKRIAAQIQPNGDLTFADLLRPLNRANDQTGPAPGAGNFPRR